MKKFLFIFTFTISNIISAQTVLLDENFESYSDFTITSMGQWGLLDLDQLFTTNTIGGDPAPPVNWVATWPNAGQKMAYQIFNFSQSNATNDFVGTTGDIRNFNPRSGQKYAACWAGKMQQSFQGNNDWLITPAVTLGASGNQISMYLKTLSSSYGDERFQIGVYVGSGNPTSAADFTIINTLPYQQVSQNLNIDNNWRNFTYALNAYAGQTIRVGIRNITQEASALLVDDVKITTAGTLNISDNTYRKDVEIYPNPASNFLKIKTEQNVNQVEIYGIDAKLVTLANGKIINISMLSTGKYFIKILLSDGTQITKQFIKK